MLKSNSLARTDLPCPNSVQLPVTVFKCKCEIVSGYVILKGLIFWLGLVLSVIAV